jgi:hypothetical protein
MSIYKKALAREFHTRASNTRRDIETEQEYGLEHARRSNVDYNVGTITSALAEASDELREVMGVIANAPAEFLKILLDDGREDNEVCDDATWSRRLCRLARLNTISETLVTELRVLLA